MGLLHAGAGALGGVLADSWREFFYCDALDANTLAAKGQKRTSSKGRSSNTKGEDNIISDGSIIAVNDGQFMIIVEQGEVVDFSGEPGEFVYDKSTEPSLFYGPLGEGIKNTFERIGHRFTFGGDTGKDQRVYFFNTKEIIGNKYGTASPVPFRVVDANIGLDVDISVRCNGEYSYKLKDPLLFYKNVCGNVEDAYTRDNIDSQLKSELLTALQPAFAQISAMGVRYSAVPAHTKELAEALNAELSETWAQLRGIEVASFGVNSIAASEEDEAMIKELQKAAVMRDPTMAAANIAAAQSDAMRMAAQNENGSMMGFMGMGMANAVGGMNSQGLYNQSGEGVPQSQYPVAQGGGFAPQGGMPQGGAGAGATNSSNANAAGDSWTCQCGTENTGNFCSSCGNPKPAPAADPNAWTCQCGTANTGNFCSNCGSPKPAPAADPNAWTCQCGTTNTGNFCSDCGNRRP